MGICKHNSVGLHLFLIGENILWSHTCQWMKNLMVIWFFSGNIPYHAMFLNSLSQSFSEGLKIIEDASNSGEWSEQMDVLIKC